MATEISRTWYDTLVDDSGSGTDGSIWDKADVDAMLDAIDSLIANDIVFGGEISERGRTTPIGEWIAPTFNAGDFTADSGTWTVDSGDVAIRYMLMGKTMTVAFDIATSDVSATPSTLMYKIPAGATAAVTMSDVAMGDDAGGTRTAIRVNVSSGGTNINFSKFGGTWTATSSDNTRVLGQIDFEIQ